MNEYTNKWIYLGLKCGTYNICSQRKENVFTLKQAQFITMHNYYGIRNKVEQSIVWLIVKITYDEQIQNV